MIATLQPTTHDGLCTLERLRRQCSAAAVYQLAARGIAVSCNCMIAYYIDLIVVAMQGDTQLQGQLDGMYT